MSLASDFNAADDGVKLVIGVVAIYVLYSLYQFVQGNTNSGGASGLLPDPNDTTGNPNSVGDTSTSAYAGNGVFGVLGNWANQASGGILQSIGNSIGGAAATAVGN